MKRQIADFVQKTLKLADAPEIATPEIKEFGHYSTNLALKAAKETGKPPMQLANDFAARLSEADSGKMFSKLQPAHPGFINFWLSPEYLQSQLLKVTRYTLHVTRPKTVLVEYSAPNIAKPMHVGHLRSTIIGDALANIYEALGYKVIRWNYLGDWGTQFGKLIAAYKLWGDKKRVSKNPIPELLKLYVRFHEELKTNPELEEQGRLEFSKLEKGDKENKKLWQWFRKVSIAEFKKIYKRLGVEFKIWRGESDYEKDLEPLVRSLLVLGGDFIQRSEGALIFPLDKFGLPPALLQKADGASLYLTRDIASLKKRLAEYKPEKILYVVGNEQSLHFDQLFTIARLLKLPKTELVHVKYGLVLGEDGKKLSTREGKTISLNFLLDEAVKRARKVVEAKNAKLSKSAKAQIAEIVGIGAIKYSDLKENRQSDIRFDWEEMLNLQGDTAPYLQYTYARLRSILRKAGRSNVKCNMSNVSHLDTDLDLGIIKKILDFTDVLELCAQTYITSHLAKYSYELAKLSNQLYETTPIIQDENKERKMARLLLIQKAAETLKHGLLLLGIKTSERI